METLKYCPPMKIDSVHRGNLLSAKEQAKLANREIRLLRGLLKNEPMNAQRAVIRLKIYYAQRRLFTMEQSARHSFAQIERRANELGLTCVRPSQL